MGILFLVALVIVVAAVGRVNRFSALQRRLAELEREVAELRRLLQGAPGRDSGARTADVRPTVPVETAVPPSPEPVNQSRRPIAVERPAAPPVAATSPASRVSPPSPATPTPPPPPSRTRPPIDWERWIGVQGAAVLGGSVLALAGLLFFRYSIEHGLISPTMRVVLATMVGLGCVAAPERAWRERYRDAANALTGAGIVILYAAFWAAKVRYGLIGLGPAFALMTMVTAAGCLLSVRHGSLLVAMLGLVGGFATPFMLSSGSDNPIGLFGYLLLLDIALLTVARQREWPLLALVSLVGTALYQALWISMRMNADRMTLGLAILGVFAILFARTARLSSPEKQTEWSLAQAGGVLLPFAFGLYIALNARLGPHIYPLILLLMLLSGASCWIAREQARGWISLAAAAAGAAVFAAWFSRSLTPALAWESMMSCGALALVFHLFVERDAARREESVPAAALSAAALLALAIGASTGNFNIPPWPWVAGWLVLAALLLRQGAFHERLPLQVVAGAAMGVGLALLHLIHGSEHTFAAWPTYLATMLAVAVAFQSVAVVRSAMPTHRGAEQSAALLALIVMLSLAGHFDYPQVPLVLGSVIAFGFLVALAATRLGAGAWYLVAVLAAAAVHSGWTVFALAFDRTVNPTAFALQAGAVVLFTIWPLLTAPRFRRDVIAWYGAALAGPAWFLSLRTLFEHCFGNGAIGLLPLGLGALTLAATARARDLWPPDDPMRRSVLTWLAAVALGFVSVAIPLQLEKSWMTIGWALEAFAVALLWRRLDHPGLKYFAVALAVLVTARLTLNQAVLVYYPRPAWRIVNWLLYTYLVPAAALLGAARTFAPLELARLQRWERTPLSDRGLALASLVTGLAAVLVAFVWINLAIADWFATGDRIVLSFQRLPARDLATSIAWALYALALLTAGMVRASSGLRWLSLGFLVLTIGKVFLYDLGELRDLYRVVSLLGLAVSLIIVSFAYQRFIFRNVPSERQ